MRRRLTYANVAATLALVFSMSGGALAATHYLINSTKQINPKVLKKLRGANGAAGLPGAAGAPGTKGEKGGQGEKGEAGPSHAWSAEVVGTPASVTVPAGTYVIHGQGAFAVHAGTHAGSAICRLTDAEKTLDEDYVTVPDDGYNVLGEKYGNNEGTNQATVTLKAAGKLTETCEESESEETVLVYTTKIVATQVGALN